MEIPKQLAQNIVDTLEKNIGYKINFMNSKGVIIASSDNNRIGEEHEGSKIVLETKKAFTTTSDMNFTYSREGIDLPVEVDDEIIGTVGITGDARETEAFGTIIKTMTEILIVNFLQSNKRQYEIEREQLIVEYLLYQTQIEFRTDEELIVEKMNMLSNQVLVWVNTKQFNNILERTELYSYFKRLLNDYDHFVSILNYEIILIVDSQIPESIIDQICKTTILNNFSLGIGHPVESISNLESSYDVAKFIALESNKKYYSYKNLQDEYILKTTNKTASTLFMKKVLHNIEAKDMEELFTFLQVYEKHNGSIKNVANELFIHRNTVQYRLDKIFNITGYNPRELSGFYKLKLAFSLWNYIDKN